MATAFETRLEDELALLWEPGRVACLQLRDVSTPQQAAFDYVTGYRSGSYRAYRYLLGIRSEHQYNMDRSDPRREENWPASWRLERPTFVCFESCVGPHGASGW